MRWKSLDQLHQNVEICSAVEHLPISKMHCSGFFATTNVFFCSIPEMAVWELWSPAVRLTSEICIWTWIIVEGIWELSWTFLNKRIVRRIGFVVDGNYLEEEWTRGLLRGLLRGLWHLLKDFETCLQTSAWSPVDLRWYLRIRPHRSTYDVMIQGMANAGKRREFGDRPCWEKCWLFRWELVG